MEIDIVDSLGPIKSEIAGLNRLRTGLPKEWFGYANREIATGKRQSAEIDVIVVSADRVFAVDLKAWRGVLTADIGGRWILDGKPQGGSASAKIRLNAKQIGSFLRSRGIQTKTGSVFVEGFVVMTDGVDYSALPEIDRDSILTIDEFCALADPVVRKRLLSSVIRTAKNRPLCDYRGEFDVLFRLGSAVRARTIRPFGFSIEATPFTEHRSGLYSEFVGTSSTLEKGIVRSWAFSALPLEHQEQNARKELLSREQYVREYLASNSEHFETDDVVLKRVLCEDNLELYEYPRGMERVGPYLGKHRSLLTVDQRIDKFKALVSTVAEMHAVKCSHADLGPHSIWLGAGTRHKLSNFASSQYPATRTLGPLRFLLANAGGASNPGLPAESDVRALARIGTDLLGDASDAPAVRRLLDALATACGEGSSLPVADAVGLLAHINAADKRFGGEADANGASVLERIKSTVVPFVDYVPSGAFSRRGDEISYESTVNGRRCIVKVWTSLNANMPLDRMFAALGQFLKLNQVRDSQHQSFPVVVDGGVGPTCAFVVYEFEEGQALGDVVAPPAEMLQLTTELVAAVLAAHDDGLWHGDLTPSNVIARWGEEGADRKPVVTLVDFVQVEAAANTPNCTPCYSPVNLDVDPFQRDAFAVAKICYELIETNCTSMPGADEALAVLTFEVSEGWRQPSLSVPRTRAALATLAKPQVQSERYTIPVASRSVSSMLEPDGDVYYLRYFPEKNGNRATLFINGLNQCVRFPVDSNSRVLSDQAWVSAVDVGRLAQMRAFAKSHEMLRGVVIELGSGTKPAGDKLQAMLDSWLGAAKSPLEGVAVSALPAQAVERVAPKIPRDREEVWQLFAEAEERTRVELVATAPSYLEGQLTIVPVEKWTPPSLEGKPVPHTVRRLNKRGDEFDIGEVEPSRSSKLTLAIRGAEMEGYARGERFVIRNGRDEAARAKKVNAARRLIADKAARPGLLTQFNKLSAGTLVTSDGAERLSRLVAESDLERYGLNPEQRRAVLNAINGRGVFLLQGPPGTGKTKTIASLVHAVVTLLKSRRVLVASQTHEAVNNAAVKITEVFRDSGTPLDLVRVGDEEDVADELMGMHTAALRRDFVAMLNAEWFERILPVGREMGLAAKEIEDLLWLQQKVLAPIAKAESWERDLRDATPGNDSRATQLRSAASEAFSDKTGTALAGGESYLAAQLAAAQWVSRKAPYADPSLCVRFLNVVSALLEASQRLQSDNSDPTFGEFLVKTRAVACGTCVGIGSSAYKLSDKVFDWVIVDEAARCTPTELAVAIQSARRVVLVGDHMQLQPFIPDLIKTFVEKRVGRANAKHWLTSDFQEMFDKDDSEARYCASLWDQYRMLEPISRIVSDLVYDKKLVCKATSDEDWLSGVAAIGGSVVTVIDTSELGSSAYEEQHNDSNSFFNLSEARAIVDLVEQIARDSDVISKLHAYVDENDEAPLGIICTYADQVACIEDLLRVRDLDHLLARVIRLGTVDSYQGRENLVVIVSLVRSNELHDVGHVHAIERINVALSRAKDRLVLVGDGRTWGSARNASYLAGKAWSYVLERADSSWYQVLRPSELAKEGVDA